MTARATRGFGLSIGARLILLTTITLTLTVGFVASYLAATQISALSSSLHRKGDTYASVMASQATSAVAFSDRETAREVLTSVLSDEDVAAVALYSASGEVLFSHGSPTLGAKQALAATKPSVDDVAGRLAVVAPVQSLEGPRGALTIDLSTAALRDANARVLWSSAIAGVLAIVVGTFFAWLLAGWVARRLRAIGDVATAFAAGDHSQALVDDPRRDEIGGLATAFNAMLTQIKDLLHRLREMAREEQARLERLVTERTEQLARRQAEMRLVFNHVDQGFAIASLDGTLADERSAAHETLLGAVPESRKMQDHVRQFSPGDADWFEAQWEALEMGVLPLDVLLAQLPTRFDVAGRALELAYTPLVDPSHVDRVLVVATDITEKLRREEGERDEKEAARLVARAISSRRATMSFCGEASRLVAAIENGHIDADFWRMVHTLKGSAGLEGLESISRLCHELESAVAESDVGGIAKLRRAVAQRWHALEKRIVPMLELFSRTGLELSENDLGELETMIARRTAHDVLARHVASWRGERAAGRLDRYAEDTRSLAARLDKLPLEVEIDADAELRMPGEIGGEFWGSFVHAIRNAVDHGLEGADARRRAGKPESGRVSLRAQRRGDAFVVAITDDGRGIDWTRVADVARARGLPTATRADLEAALFCDGVSTATQVSETSGRGVGMAALAESCRATGGHIEITSELGKGTTIAFVWPNDTQGAQLERTG